MITRIRKRDLFAIVGETILTPVLRAKLAATGGRPEDNIKRQLLELFVLNKKPEEENIPQEDIFCQLVKIGYGKGNVNPVSSLTAFYEPNKGRNKGANTSDDAWCVGVMPEGEKTQNKTYIILFDAWMMICLVHRLCESRDSSRV